MLRRGKLAVVEGSGYALETDFTVFVRRIGEEIHVLVKAYAGFINRRAEGVFNRGLDRL